MVSPEVRPGVPIADIDSAKELGVRSSFKPPVRNPSKRKPCATRSVALTEAGEPLLARVAPAFRDIEDALDDLNNFRGAPIRRLSFNTARASAKMVLLPLVARFLESHPKLNIEIVVDNDLVDMVSEGFDAGVRFGEIVALCRNVAADLAPLAIDEGYDLSFEQNTEQAMIQGDAVSLERAVTNLVQNAIEHAGNQGVIVVRVEPDGVIEVSDDGPGIPEAERERVFEAFYRLKPRERGAGLGLNLVLQITERHNGRVSILTTRSGGACFRLAFQGARI